jgi:leucyl aminopeptidase (aminopeptidase T)
MMTLMAPRKVHGEESPKAIAETMKNVNVFFIPVTKSIAHTRAVKEATGMSARGLVLPEWNEKMLISGGIEADFDKQKPICKKIAQMFQEGGKAHLATLLGTDLYLDLEGRRGNSLTCIVESGEFFTMPTIEAIFSPPKEQPKGPLWPMPAFPISGPAY